MATNPEELSTDEKISRILQQVSPFYDNRVFDLIELCTALERDGEEMAEIIKRLEIEGFTAPIEGHGFRGGSVIFTDEGRRVGRLNLYPEMQAARVAGQVELARKAKMEISDRWIRKLEIIMVVFSSIGTVAVGIWGNILNQDIKDVKTSMDSIRLEMRLLRKSIESMESMPRTQTLPPVPQTKSKLDTLILPRPKTNSIAHP